MFFQSFTILHCKSQMKEIFRVSNNLSTDDAQLKNFIRDSQMSHYNIFLWR